jgi:hypothetical protein
MVLIGKASEIIVYQNLENFLDLGYKAVVTFDGENAFELSANGVYRITYVKLGKSVDFNNFSELEEALRFTTLFLD